MTTTDYYHFHHHYHRHHHHHQNHQNHQKSQTNHNFQFSIFIFFIAKISTKKIKMNQAKDNQKILPGIILILINPKYIIKNVKNIFSKISKKQTKNKKSCKRQSKDRSCQA